ncbi:MAG: hypothetical protein RBU30_11735 [Polyangia bacterium]|jgi:hypothetical protein|nr:hypothetical protein [Polyangia bacterium]
MRSSSLLFVPLVTMAGLALAFCGDDDNANDRMIGAECSVPADCDDDNDDTLPLDCITAFAGGYCGDASCIATTDCPTGSACVDYEGTNYCFLTCKDKADCNKHRSAVNESNCSSNYPPVDVSSKVCIPPSSGL